MGRVSYRMLQAYHINDAGAATRLGPPSGLSGFVSSPLTLGLFFVLAGYYVCYFGLVLWKSKHLKAQEGVDNSSPLGA
jgi:hypothetical protein